MANATFTNTDGTNDIVTGTSLDDILTADNTTVTTAGDANEIDAGAGSDTVVMTGATLVHAGDTPIATEATFNGTTGIVTVGAAAAQDTFELSNVEFVEFENGTLDLSATAAAAQYLINDATTDTLDVIGDTSVTFDVTNPLRFDGTSVTLGTDGVDGTNGNADDETFTVSQIDGTNVVPGNISIYNDAGVLVGRVALNSGAGTFEFSVENDYYTTLTFGQTEVVTFDVTVLGSEGSTFTQTYSIDVVGDFSENADTFNADNQGTLDRDVANTIDALGGDDFISAGDGADNITGNDGNDVIVGGQGADTLTGDDGNDQLWAGSDDTSADVMTGGDGDDTLGGGDGADTLTGDSTTDANADGVADEQGVDVIYGGDGNDTIFTGANGVTSTSNGDSAWGGAGSDTITGDDGTDILGGGDDADLINAGGGNDTIYAGADMANDTVDAGAGDDVIFAGAGDDVLTGGAGDDEIYGGEGGDTVTAGIGDDEVYGGDGADSLIGGDNDDMLDGGDGADTLNGGDDVDVLNGGAGDDVLTGGGVDNDLDTFVFAAGDGNDQITDFEDGTDMIDLTALGVTSLSDLVTEDDGSDFIIHTSDEDSIVVTGMSGNITDADMLF
ncbi:calcium-binding protein [Pseudophaeobacter sp.]|uniref:calcium-binding protein n=1 Tax=Pseudophaeobacter sp. TaxID=1971739 RepID=UPI003297BE05